MYTLHLHLLYFHIYILAPWTLDIVALLDRPVAAAVHLQIYQKLSTPWC